MSAAWVTQQLTSKARVNEQRLLFVLDEVSTLGFLPWIESAMAFSAGTLAS